MAIHMDEEILIENNSHLGTVPILELPLIWNPSGVRINKKADEYKHSDNMRDADNGVFKIMVDGESQSNA